MPFSAIADTYNMQDPSAHSQIDSAIRERGGTTGLPAPSSGTDIQSISYWRSMQTAIETLAISGTFLKGYDVLPAAANWNPNSLPYYATASELWQASIERDAPRRCPSVFGQFSSGLSVTGDILGPWLLQDLKSALQKLKIKAVRNTSADRHKIDIRPTPRTWYLGGNVILRCFAGTNWLDTTSKASWHYDYDTNFRLSSSYPDKMCSVQASGFLSASDQRAVDWLQFWQWYTWGENSWARDWFGSADGGYCTLDSGLTSNAEYQVYGVTDSFPVINGLGGNYDLGKVMYYMTHGRTDASGNSGYINYKSFFDSTVQVGRLLALGGGTGKGILTQRYGGTSAYAFHRADLPFDDSRLPPRKAYGFSLKKETVWFIKPAYTYT